MNKKTIYFIFFLFSSIILFSQNKVKKAIDTVNNGRFDIILFDDFSWKYKNNDSVFKLLAKEDSLKLYKFIYENRHLSCNQEWFDKDWDTTRMWSYEGENYKIYEDTLLIDLVCGEHKFVMPRKGIISSKFGWRGGGMHQGIDIQLKIGDTILAAFDGKVKFAGRYYGYGYVVVIRGYNGLETLYAHLSKINCTVNQEVTAGDLIGLGGATGRATGPHLHFEIRYKNTPIDPQLIIDFVNNKLIKDDFLIVPKHFGEQKEANEAKYYTVKSGDTLGSIANRNGTSIRNICKLNNITETTILSIGKNLRIR